MCCISSSNIRDDLKAQIFYFVKDFKIPQQKLREKKITEWAQQQSGDDMIESLNLKTPVEFTQSEIRERKQTGKKKIKPQGSVKQQ